LETDRNSVQRSQTNGKTRIRSIPPTRIFDRDASLIPRPAWPVSTATAKRNRPATCRPVMILCF